MTTKAQIKERDKAREELRKLLTPGDTVYTVLKHVSKSGMYRAIDAYIMRGNTPVCISRKAATAIDGRYDDKHQAVGMSGCGMDMGFALVYELAYALYPGGFGIVGTASLYPEGIRPGSKEHADALRSQGVVFRGRNGDPSGWDNDGGYALSQRWM